MVKIPPVAKAAGWAKDSSWLRVRVDRGDLYCDPLAAVPGAGWATSGPRAITRITQVFVILVTIGACTDLVSQTPQRT